MQVTTYYRKKGKKDSITYERIHVNEFTEEVVKQYFMNKKAHKGNSKKQSATNALQARISKYQYKFGKYAESALDVCCGFDIETTKIDNNKTFMFGWQFGIENTVIWGETWEQFISFLGQLKTILQANSKQRLIVFVANLGYEWQFMKHHLNITRSFFKELRQPVEIEHDGFVIFKECLSWGGSLAKLASDYCKIPKLKGDLDYSIYRESYKDFTSPREWAYIDFDVLILTQFARWFNDTYLKALHFKPVTITQALNRRIQDRQKATNEQTPGYSDFPKNYRQYDVLMSWVYRGGYVHANKNIVGKVLHNVWSYDFTSSYPSVIENNLFPWRFDEVEPGKLDLVNFNFNTDKYAFYGLFEFEGIEATTCHSIESKSKCVLLEGETIDNGRVQSAEKMVVWLASPDYLSYREFYHWKSVKCHKLLVSKLRPLPRYLVDEMNSLYTTKANLKKAKKNYALEKSYVNTCYGLSVKRIIVKDCELQGTEVIHIDKEVEECYEKYREKSLLLPQWGCWVSAYARRNLLSTVYRLETEIPNNTVVYCDTDSIKFTNPVGKKIIKEYNEKIQRRVTEVITEKQLDYNIFWDLGSFDCEYSHGIQSIKTLGAKRYIHTYTEGGAKHYQATVAGLPKKEYISRYGKNDSLFFDSFEDELVVKNCKLSSSYNDNEPFVITRLGKAETVYSCVTLNDSDFSLNMDDSWMQLLIGLNSGVREQRNI